MLFGSVKAQVKNKVNNYQYNYVDTLTVYQNAQTITYKNYDGKSITDTICFSKMKKNINIKIKEADVVIYNQEDSLKINP
jgi:hypothetical protein